MNQCVDIGIISGIYKIINKINGKYYVGSSINLNIGSDCRLKTHARYLKSNRHKNDYLQNAWNKYGKNAFEFVVVEIVDPVKEKLLMVEQKYLDIAKNEPNKTYNLCFIASGAGELSEYSKKKKSDSLKRSYKNNPKLIENHINFMKAYFSDPKNKEYLKTEKYRESLRVGQKLRHANVTQKKKHIEIMNSERVKKKISDGVLKKYKECPELKKKIGESKKSKTVYTFKNVNTNEVFTGTQYNFRAKYNLNKNSISNLIKKRNNSLHGWILL
jgi:group I intron endonuclease